MKWLAVVVVTLWMVPLGPTWDPSLCRTPAFASTHTDLCGNPLLNRGQGGGGSDGGLFGTIGRVLGGLTGGLL